jgi:hypothetical protein
MASGVKSDAAGLRNLDPDASTLESADFHRRAQNLRRARTHDATVHEVAFLKRRADVFAADGPGLFVLVTFHQVNSASRFIVGGETDVDRFDLQVASELVEDFLSVEVTPDGFAVVVRCIRVLTSDDQMCVAHVLVR